MLAIVTGTIKPNSDLGQVVIQDAEERLKQYMESLAFLIESKSFSKIVFCENSNFGICKLKELEQKAENRDVKLEVLSFEGSAEKIRAYGKGYGEGEIMKYVFEHSQILEEENYFVKITGRMKIANIKDIVDRLKDKKTYFNIPNRTVKTIYDTRVYAMSKIQFQKYFINRYSEVSDDKGYYLEHVYTRILNENGIMVTNFPRYPRIVGVSGSTGIVYEYTEWKCRIKDIISKFGGYKVR